MAVTLSAGGSLAWWRAQVGGGASYDELVAEAAGVAPGAEGLVFLPYLSGERTPHLDPRARGAFVGLALHHTRAHLTRAVMEGVVLSLRDGLEVMRALGTDDEDVRAVGGGARSALWRGLQADVFGRPIRRTTVDEGPAYGAALLGGVAAGVFADAARRPASCGCATRSRSPTRPGSAATTSCTRATRALRAPARRDARARRRRGVSGRRRRV